MKRIKFGVIIFSAVLACLYHLAPVQAQDSKWAYHPLGALDVTIEEIPASCEGNFDGDSDADGQDLAGYIADSHGIEPEDFAEDFGRINCPEVTVPKVLGLSESEAVAAIEGANLIANIVNVYRVTIPSGEVADQNPLAGSVVRTGSSVDLEVVQPPPVGTGESIPGAWAGKWQITIGFKNLTRDNIWAHEVITDTICPGDPVGAELMEALASQDPDFISAECTGSAAATQIEASCNVQMIYEICTLDVSAQFAMDLSGDTLTGGGDWTAAANCNGPLPPDEATFLISGNRLGTDQSLCQAPKSSLIQKFLRLPFNLPLLQGGGL